MARGDGATTKQIQQAPPGAIFVWCNGHVDYPQELAKRLGRSDLRIEGPSFFEDRWQGLRKPVVVDHAARQYFTDAQLRGWRKCMNYLATVPVQPSI